MWIFLQIKHILKRRKNFELLDLSFVHMNMKIIVIEIKSSQN